MKKDLEEVDKIIANKLGVPESEAEGIFGAMVDLYENFHEEWTEEELKEFERHDRLLDFWWFRFYLTCENWLRFKLIIIKKYLCD